MSSEQRRKAEPSKGAFNRCLVDGDSEANARERKTKRRAIGISILMQTAGLAVLVIAPLLAKTAELTERIAVPLPPYRHLASARTSSQRPANPPPTQVCLFCSRKDVSPRVPTLPRDSSDDSPLPLDIDRRGPVDSPIDGIVDRRTAPPRPEDPPRQKRRIHETQIDPALLTRRIEPAFPALARQLRKSGKVELHAIIATDGSVQSLEVVSGYPLFVISALEAVKQWHYKPTYLNGQPVEIDTYITVIYTLQ